MFDLNTKSLGHNLNELHSVRHTETENGNCNRFRWGWVIVFERGLLSRTEQDNEMFIGS